MKRLLCSIALTSSVLLGCDLQAKDSDDTPHGGRQFGSAWLEYQRPLTTLNARELSLLCQDVAEYYYPPSLVRGRCTLEVLARDAQPATMERKDVALDPSESPGPAEGGDDEPSDAGSSQPSEDEDAAVALPEHSDAGAPVESDAGELAEEGEGDAADSCARRAERCTSMHRGPAERLEGYCETRE